MYARPTGVQVQLNASDTRPGPELAYMEKRCSIFCLESLQSSYNADVRDDCVRRCVQQRLASLTTDLPIPPMK
jgi:hypothetical protein